LIYIYVFTYKFYANIQIKSLTLFHITWPQPDHSCSTCFSNYPKVICCQTYRPQPTEHVRETIATDYTP